MMKEAPSTKSERNDVEETKTCPKCNCKMLEGFVIDRGDMNLVRNPEWTNGKFVPSFWSGGKIGHMTVPVRTFRCESCGYLESYATPAEE